MRKAIALLLLAALPLAAAVENRYTDPAQRIQLTDIKEVPPIELKTMILEAHRLANAYRAENGKPPLAIDPKISHWAQVHSEWMAAHRYGISHEGFYDRMALVQEEVPKVYTGAENVAFAWAPFQEPVTTSITGWINSPGHRANLIGNYNLCGYGIARNKENGSWYLTHLFANSSESSYVAGINSNEWNGGSKEEPVAEASPPPPPQEEQPIALVKDFPDHYFRFIIQETFNRERAKVNRRELIEHSIPNYYSQRHSDAMALGEVSFGDSGRSERFEAVKKCLPQIRGIVEWYAKIPSSNPNPSKAAATEWLADSKKLGAILSQYNVIGVGVSKSSDGHYYYSAMLLFSTHPALN